MNNITIRHSNLPKSFGKIMILFCIVFFLTKNANAQKKSGDDYRPNSLLERVYVGAYVNSPFIGGSTNGSVFSLGIQPFAAYKWNDYFSTGIAIGYEYTYIWIPNANPTSNPSTSLNDLTATTFTRATIADRFILQLEGGYYSLERRITAFETERINFPVAYVGAGYTNRFYEILLTYEFLGNLGFYQIPIEYKAGLVYHF